MQTLRRLRNLLIHPSLNGQKMENGFMLCHKCLLLPISLSASKTQVKIQSWHENGEATSKTQVSFFLFKYSASRVSYRLLNEQRKAKQKKAERKDKSDLFIIAQSLFHSSLSIKGED